jgi:signal peptidase I
MTAPQAPVDAPPPEPPPEAAAEVEERNPLKTALEWVAILAVALIAAFFINAFFIKAFWIPSESMDPTLKINDRVLVNKLSYKLHDIHRKDIVVFERPPAEQGGDPSIKDLIKRVIALPGEKVEGRGGHIWINDKQLNEPYLPKDTTTLDFPAQTIPPKNYWVMGDNRLRSQDSRYFGPISKDLIVGRAFIRIWPVNHLHLL